MIMETRGQSFEYLILKHIWMFQCEILMVISLLGCFILLTTLALEMHKRENAFLYQERKLN